MTNPTIPYFHWVDRQTAATEVFALLQKQPIFSLPALKLLKVLRPQHLIPELVKMLHESTFGEKWLDTLNVILYSEVDVYIPEFRQFLNNEVVDAYRNYKKTSAPFGMTRYILNLIDACPSNRDWFWEQMDTLDEVNQLYVLILGSFDLESALAQYLLPKIFALLKDNPQLIYTTMTVRNGQKLNHFFAWVMRSWGNPPEIYRQIVEHFHAEILNMIVDEFENKNFHSLSVENPVLKELFWDKYPSLQKKCQESCQARKLEQRAYLAQVTQYRKLPVYVRLKEIYDQAKNGNQSAYDQLLSYTRYSIEKTTTSDAVDNTQLIQALAIHLLGRLPLTEAFIETAYTLLEKPKLRWYDGEIHPVDVEAGNVLLKIPTPKTWETFMNIYFLPTHYSPYFLQSWSTRCIGHLTDILSNEQPRQIGNRRVILRPREHWWFEKALQYVTEEDFKRL